MIPDNEYYYNHGILENCTVHRMVILEFGIQQWMYGATGPARLAEIEGT